MIVVHEFAALGKIGADDRPVAVGEQRIVASSGRERTLRHANDDHLVEFEAQRGGGRADEHAVAEGASAAEVVAELELKGSAEGRCRRVGIDAVEVAKPVDGGIDALGGGLFLGGQSPRSDSPPR